MFNKLLIANRGEIAVRVLRTCREMGIRTVALYEAPDIGSLHVRLADECVLLDHMNGYYAVDRIIEIAKVNAADAIHPGYGFLAEQPNFIRECERAGIRLVGPRLETLRWTQDKLLLLETARRGGFPTVRYAPVYYEPDDDDVEPQAIYAAAEELGYPIIVKPGCAGSGKGERVVFKSGQLASAFLHAAAAGDAAFCDRRVYLEKAIYPASKVCVQVLADRYGNVVHLGESQSTLYPGNQKIIQETPAPCLDRSHRKDLWKMSKELAKLFFLTNFCTLDFMVDEAGKFYLTEITPCLPVDHPVIEMVTRLDLVREQIRLAAGLPLEIQGNQIRQDGVAMICRINVEDPEHDFLPSPGRLRQVRLPAGNEVRVDTYVYSGCEAPVLYDPLIATLAVWGSDRNACLERMRRALHEFEFFGLNTNLNLLKDIFNQQDFVDGSCVITARAKGTELKPESNGKLQERDLAIIAGLLYEQRACLPGADLDSPEHFRRRWKRDGNKAAPDLSFLRTMTR